MDKKYYIMQNQGDGMGWYYIRSGARPDHETPLTAQKNRRQLFDHYEDAEKFSDAMEDNCGGWYEILRWKIIAAAGMKFFQPMSNAPLRLTEKIYFKGD
jgi:hypothetical protein